MANPNSVRNEEWRRGAWQRYPDPDPKEFGTGDAYDRESRRRQALRDKLMNSPCTCDGSYTDPWCPHHGHGG